MGKAKSANNLTLVTQSKFAELIGVSVTSIRAWKTGHDFADCYEGTDIVLEKAVRFLYDWKEEIRTTKEEANQTGASEEKKKWDAKMAEHKYKMMVEEVIPKDEYLQTEKERFLIIRDSVKALPEQLAPLLGLDAPQKKLVESTCRSALENMKKTFKGRSKDWADYMNKGLIENDNGTGTNRVI